jgi:hypothetical protein
MPKGRHRRYRQTRQHKQRPAPLPHLSEPCVECSRAGGHAHWCLAEADLGYVDEPGTGDSTDPRSPR